VELLSDKHRTLKLDPACKIEFAASQHLLNFRVTEVSQAICNFPVFFNKNIHSGYWNLSGIASFEMGSSLFVENGLWQAVYEPSSMQSYPFYLMNSNKGDRQYTIGIDENYHGFSDDKGEVLFESNGKASLFLSGIKTRLEADIQNDIQTFQFGQTLQELGLLKSINVIVQYKNQPQQTLTGLYTIDEDKLHSLDDSQLGDLNRRGYLTPINGLLLSISQLNGLIQKNNKRQVSMQILSVKLELSKN
jgi:hypothetical protein